MTKRAPNRVLFFNAKCRMQNAKLRTRKDASKPSPLGSEAKLRVLNESPVDSQTPRCPSPQARQVDHNVADEVAIC